MPRAAPFAVALAGGLLPLAIVVALFFPGLLGYRPGPSQVEVPLVRAAVFTALRIVALLVAVALVGWFAGRRFPTNASEVGVAAALPSALGGGLLGVWGAMQPVHLVIVVVLVAAIVAAGLGGARWGARRRV